MPAPLLVTFAAGDRGAWRIDAMHPVRGPGLAAAPRLAVVESGTGTAGVAGVWTLRGVTSNLRYTTAEEKRSLEQVQEGLGRPAATCAALIPIRKSEAWWSLAQNERRAIFETRSRHIAIGQAYLPGVARRLHHERDLGEPFDFLTWFEFAPDQAPAFERMLAELRATEEWRYVEREVDIRVSRNG
jgi:chlorite dismutase